MTMAQVQRNDFAVSQKIVHWLMASLIMLDLYIAQKFGGVMEDWDRFESRSDHATLGTIVAVLFCIRIFLRWKHGAPPLPTDMPGYQKFLAHAAHWLLYGLIGALIATGILSAMNADSLVTPFGLFSYGDGRGVEATFTYIRGFHELTTNLIIALIGLHIVAALFHLIIVRDGVTGRMLKFWKSEKQA